MFLMLDTNIIMQDFFLKSEPYKLLFDNIGSLGICIFNSNIVFEESVQKYKEKLDDYNKKIREFSNIVPFEFCRRIEIEEIEKLVSEYKKYLIKRMHKNIYMNSRVSSYKNVGIDLDKLFIRALEKNKPFDEKGRGFRDTLIWEELKWAAKTYCSEGQKFIFITNNLSDFADLRNDNGVRYKLAPNLIEELKNEEFNPELIEIYNSIGSFNKNVLIKIRQEFNDYKNKLNNELNSSLTDFIASSIDRSEDPIIDSSILEHYKVQRIYNVLVKNIRRNWANAEEEFVYIIVEFDMTIKNSNEDLKELQSFSCKTCIHGALGKSEFYDIEQIDFK